MKLSELFIRLDDRLSKLPRLFILLAGGLMLLLIGWIDYCSGIDFSIAFFYLIPVGLIGWFTSRNWVVLTAFACAGTSFAADIAGRPQSTFLISIYLWNNLMRLGFFLVVGLLAITLHAVLDQEKELANTDFLTGMANARAFSLLAEREIALARRYQYPVCLAYMDVDNFKLVNDHFGHRLGDEVLRRIALEIRQNLRGTDLVARIGGDEFVILFLNSNLEASEKICLRTQAALASLAASESWPISISIGVVTFEPLPATIDEMLQSADHAMYEVKRQGKDAVHSRLIRG